MSAQVTWSTDLSAHQHKDVIYRDNSTQHLQTLSQRTGTGNCSFNKHFKKLGCQLLLKYLSDTWETEIHATLLKQELRGCLLLSLPYPQGKLHSPKKGDCKVIKRHITNFSWEVLSRAFKAKLTFHSSIFNKLCHTLKKSKEFFIKRQWKLLMRSNNGALLKDVD